MRNFYCRQRRLFWAVVVTLGLLLFPPSLALADDAKINDEGDTISSFNRWIISSDYTDDGAFLVTAGGESLLYRPGDVIVWKADGSRVGNLSGHATAVGAVDTSSDGKLVATAGYDGVVKLWDMQGRKLKADLNQHKGWVRSLAFSPDGAQLATAGEDGNVIVWNTLSGKSVTTVVAHKGPVTAITFSQDGKTFVTGGGDNLVKVWNAVDGKEIKSLAGHEDTIWSIAYSPNRPEFVSTGADKTVRVWSADNFKQTGILAGHKDWVTSAAFSSDGGRLVTASLDGVVKFWDVQTKREQEGSSRQSDSVWCVAIAPDDQSIFIGTHRGGKVIAAPAAKLLPLPQPDPKTVAKSPVAQSMAKPLIPAVFRSEAGAAGIISDDGTVLVSGKSGKDIYRLTATVPEGVPVTAIRIEVLPDETLPSRGPGRAANGNFVLSEFSAVILPTATQKKETPVIFNAVTADYSQAGWPVTSALDGKQDTGWGIAGAIGQSHSAVFTIQKGLVVEGGSVLAFVLSQQFTDGRHSIGKFRLLVEQEVQNKESVKSSSEDLEKGREKKQAANTQNE